MNLHYQYSGNKNFKAIDLEEKILFRTSSLRVPPGKPREEALAEIKRLISEKESRIISVRQKSATLIRWISLAAAGIILLLGLWQLFSVTSQTKVMAGSGSHISYILTDGSEVKLNAGSRITFNKRNFNSERKVSFEGEGFFNVTKGSSFRIITPGGNILVLGTSFNVFSRDNIFKVSCLEGKIMVNSNNQSVTINPGESAELSGGYLKSFSDTRIKYITAWINGEFYFENTPLNLVFNEIERQFNVKFVGKDRADEFFTGSFVNKDLRTALDIVCFPMGLTYEIEKGKISVNNKK